MDNDDEDDRHPGPLRIVKRSSQAPLCHTDDNSNVVPRSPGFDDHPRSSSDATEESMAGIRQDLDAGHVQRPISVPKKRITLSSWTDGGASRFQSSSAAHSACVARRRLNNTDSFGASGEGDYAGLGEDAYNANGQYASARPQYQRDAQHGLGQWLHLSSQMMPTCVSQRHSNTNSHLGQTSTAMGPAHTHNCLPVTAGGICTTKQNPWTTFKECA